MITFHIMSDIHYLINARYNNQLSIIQLTSNSIQ